jgi:zinc protease
VFARAKGPADVAAIEGEIWSAIDALAREPVSQRRLDETRSRFKYEFLGGLSTPSGVCESLAYPIAITGGIDPLEQLFATLAQVTPEDVRDAARHYLRVERSTVAVLHAAGEPPLALAGAEEVELAPVALAGAEAPVLLPVAQDPNVAFKVWFRVGSQDDPPGKEGLAALTAALVGESGTRALTYDELLERLYPLAASIDVSVDREMTVASGLVHRDNVGAFYDLYTGCLVEPGFRPADLERVRDQHRSAIEKTLRYSSDEELGKAVLYAEVFAARPTVTPSSAPSGRSRRSSSTTCARSSSVTARATTW